jgi:hypothetical protein
MALATSVVLGQSDRWYPSRWGADDQRGAANRLTSAKVLEAKDLIKQGTVYQLGHVYESGMPMFGTRHYSLRIPQAFAMPGRNQAVYHDEIIRSSAASSDKSVLNSTASVISASAICSTTAIDDPSLRKPKGSCVSESKTSARS